MKSILVKRQGQTAIIDEQTAKQIATDIFEKELKEAKRKYGEFDVGGFELEFGTSPLLSVFGYSSIKKGGEIGIIIPSRLELEDLETTIGHELGHRILISNNSRLANTAFSHAIAQGIALDLMGYSKLNVIKGLFAYAISVDTAFSSRIAALAISAYLLLSTQNTEERLKTLIRK